MIHFEFLMLGFFEFFFFFNDKGENNSEIRKVSFLQCMESHQIQSVPIKISFAVYFYVLVGEYYGPSSFFGQTLHSPARQPRTEKTNIDNGNYEN